MQSPQPNFSKNAICGLKEFLLRTLKIALNFLLETMNIPKYFNSDFHASGCPFTNKMHLNFVRFLNPQI